MSKEQAPTTVAEIDAKKAELQGKIDAKKAEMNQKAALNDAANKAGMEEKKAMLQELIDAGADQAAIEFIKKRIAADEEKIKEKEEKQEAEKEQTNNVKQEIKDTLDKEEDKKQAEKLDSRMKQIGLSEKDFESTPEWAKLSYGQKMLVLEQAAQNTLTNVKEAGQKRFEEGNKKAWFGKKIVRNMFKAYYVNKEEKKAVLDAAQGKLAPKAEELKALVETMVDMNIPVMEGKNGKMLMEFYKAEGNLSPEKKALVERYNALANEFSRMPNSWSSEKAAKNDSNFNKKNHQIYTAKKIEYDNARKALINALCEGNKSKESIRDLMFSFAEKDGAIRSLQITSKNPDAISELKNIHDSSSFKRLFKDNETIWRGIYMGTGALARGVAVPVFGTMAGPLVASIIGGARARRKANEKINAAFDEGREMETFRERRAAGKKGLYDNKNDELGLVQKALSGKNVNAREVAGFIDADSQIQRINNLMSKIDNAKNPAEKATIMRQLTARLDYIEGKMDAGLINYGEKNSAGLSYAFFKLYSEAQVKSQVMNEDDPLDLTPEQIQNLYALDTRRETITNYVTSVNELRREIKQSNFKDAEMVRGALVGAGFSLLGSRIYGMFQHGHSGSLEDHASGAHNGGHPGTPDIPKVTEAPTPTHHGVEAMVGKGHGAIKTISELQDKLKAEYPDLSKAPASVQHILNTKADRLAIEYGMFKPGQDAESALTKIGDGFKVDENGNVVFHQAGSGKDMLLEKGLDDHGSGSYEGAFRDSDHSGEARLEQIQQKQFTEEYLKTHPDAASGSTGEVGKYSDEYLRTHPDVNGANPDGTGTIDQEYLKTHPDVNSSGNINPNDIPKVETNPAQDNGDIRPLEGKYNTGEAANSGDIYPTRGIYNTGGNGGEAIYRNASYDNQGIDNGFTRELKMTDVALREANMQNANRNIAEVVYENREGTGPINFEADPRHLDNAADIRHTFGRSNVVMDRPDSNTINGVDTREWNDASDEVLKQKVDINSYAEYEKESAMQRLLGHGEHGVKYDPSLDKNVEGTSMYYYKEVPEWGTVNKIPAKYFLDFKDPKFIDGSNIQNPEINRLVNAGVLRENVNTLGESSYEFANQKELTRMMNLYEKVDPLNSKPIGNESLERYVSRITRDLHEAKDGTLYMFKNGSYISEKAIDDGSIVKPETLNNLARNMNSRGSGNIYPTLGIYNTGDYSPNINLVNRFMDNISGYRRWTH